MKTHITLLISAIVITLFGPLPTHASRARSLIWNKGGETLPFVGETGDEGSFYVDDPYNIFYNPAYVNDLESWVIIERFNGADSFNGHAMGGISSSLGRLKYAIYMDRMQEGDDYQQAAGRIHPLDLIVGANTGIKWGLGLSAYSYKNSEQTYGTSLTASLGVVAGMFEPFGAIRLVTRENISATQYNDNRRFRLGMKVRLGSWTPYVYWLQTRRDINGNTGGALTIRGMGIGKEFQIAPSIRSNLYATYYLYTNRSSVNSASYLPLGGGIEVDVTTWLTLRTALHYYLIGKMNGASDSNRTQAKLGLTIKSKKIDLDWGVGGSTGSLDEDRLARNTFGLDGLFFTAASLTYKL